MRSAVALAVCSARQMRGHDHPVRVVGSQMIWDAAPHNAFTDLTRWKGQWYCSFREGEAHSSYDGTARILRSADGDSWQTAAHFVDEGHDLRDPKLCVLPDGRLLVGVGARVQDEQEQHETGYPGLSFHDKRVGVSYYSSQSGKCAIYIAQLADTL